MEPTWKSALPVWGKGWGFGFEDENEDEDDKVGVHRVKRS
jgi:hypothetical protein